MNSGSPGVKLENAAVARAFFIWKLPGRQLMTEGAVAE